MNPESAEALVSAGEDDPNMLAKDMFAPASEPPGGTFAGTCRETTSGLAADDGLEAASVRCAALRCTGIGGPTAIVGLDPTGRDGYAAYSGTADANGPGADEVWTEGAGATGG